ncbi:ADP-ribosylation/crystallin J1 [Xanthomonas sp. NCPPB 3582]|uniref:ADP-ribosylation/crystallin J1 n=1 Tax=Xanthomonas sp. NCPPB 3582 TaxID=487557 RepID=UPI003556C357
MPSPTRARLAAPSSEVGNAAATVTLHRPAGPEEYALVRDSGFRRWPLPLPEQPLFYPVTNRRYAEQIASHWNVKHSGVGHVAQFAVRATFVEPCAIEEVGGTHHTEWWIRAEDLNALNNDIVGLVDIIGRFDAPPTEHDA